MGTEAGEDEERVVEAVGVAVDDHGEQDDRQRGRQHEGDVGEAVEALEGVERVVVPAALPLPVADAVDLLHHLLERDVLGAEREGAALEAAAVEVGREDELALRARRVDVVPLPDHLQPRRRLETAALLLQLGRPVALAEELRNPLYRLHNRILQP